MYADRVLHRPLDLTPVDDDRVLPADCEVGEDDDA